MKFLITLFVLLTPIIASANGGGAAWLLVYAFGGLIVLGALLIPASLFYVLRNRRHTLLLMVGAAVSLIYALIINFTTPYYDIGEMFSFASITVAFFTLVISVILWTRKRYGKDDSSLKKISLHTIITGAFSLIFTILYGWGSGFILYTTNCDTNLILYPEIRLSEQGICVVTQAIKLNNPDFCNKAENDQFQTRDFCKARVYIESVESGNISDCTHIKTLSRNAVDNATAGWSKWHQQEFLVKCGIL